MTKRSDTDAESPPPLVSALHRGNGFEHPTEAIVLIETHISWVLLTGRYAYKIKKPVTLPFLDFSTLDARRHFCREELRINRRLAPELYLDVVPITGTSQSPHVNGEGEAIEYAVRMHQFPDRDRLDRVAARGDLHSAHIQALAETIARFHAQVAVADARSPFADSEHLRRETMENFQALTEENLPPRTRTLIEDIRRWSARSLVELGRRFRARKPAGWIRECHGDMHLANMALFNGEAVIFDALEFEEDLRWIDVQSDLAFFAMDLDYRGFAHFVWLLMSRYLELTGDYVGLRVFRHYMVYRSMVRTKVAALRAQQCQPGTHAHSEAVAELTSHVELAHDLLQAPGRAPLVITHGLSASGKSWLSERLLTVIGAIRIRSDVERQRLARIGSLDVNALYTPRAVARTYESLAIHARTILECGYPVIVDATFLKREHRSRFLSIARELGQPFVILSMQAPEGVLEARIAERRREAVDASEATVEVLQAQRQELEAFTGEERETVLALDGTAQADIGALARRILAKRSAPLARRLDARVDEED